MLAQQGCTETISANGLKLLLLDFMLLISNRSQMTSKCDNKNMAHKPLDKCVTDVLTIF